MLQILFAELEKADEKPDAHGVSSRRHLPENSTDGEADRHGHGINKVIEQSRKQQESGRRYAKRG